MSYKLKTKNTATSDVDAVYHDESLGLISLEPRILLDAAGFVTGAEVAVEAMAAEGVENGVQAIFEDSEEPAATPFDGPWLGEVTVTDTGEGGSATPFDGPWLGDIGEPTEDEPAATPFDGPWLGEVQLAQDVTSGDGDTAATPFDGPWL